MQSSRSLLLITVDCFRADHAGFLGYTRPTTPFLDSLARESVVFSNAIVAGAPTYFSFPAIMASRFPLGLGRDVIGLAPVEPTIASALSEAGYATAAFLGANPYLSARFGYDAGFRVFKDFLDTESGPLSAPTGSDGRNAGFTSRWNARLATASHRFGPVGALYDELYFQYCQRVGSPAVSSLDQMRRFPSADVIIDHARDWLSGIAGQPFFLWLHLMDPHSPYYPKQDALDLMGSSIDASQARYLNSYWNRGDIGASRLTKHREAIVKLYDAGIRWVDTQVAHLADTLRQLGLWQDCVIAVTADHGEEFLDHGGRYHPPSRVTEDLVRVPLLLHGPGVPQVEVAEPFSLMHLAPTLLDLVDIPIPGNFRGRSHAGLLKNNGPRQTDAIVECISGCTNPFVAENRLHGRVLAVREARYKMVMDFNSTEEKLFDLRADPGELRPIPTEEQKPVRRRLLERARQHLADSLRSRDDDYRMAARLRDLRLEWTNPVTPASI